MCVCGNTLKILTDSSQKSARTMASWPCLHSLCRHHGVSGTEIFEPDMNATSPLSTIVNASKRPVKDKKRTTRDARVVPCENG